jgi:hypothetical protein
MSDTEQREPTDPVRVEPRDGLSIWIEFCDGTSGKLDLSRYAAGPAFAGWRDRSYFESVHINEYEEVEWGDDLQMCPDALYIDLTGRPWEDIWPRLVTDAANV